MVSMIHWSWINCCSCFGYSRLLSTHSGLNDYVFDWIMVWTRPIFSNNHRWPSMIWSLLKDADSVSVGRRSQSNPLFTCSLFCRVGKCKVNPWIYFYQQIVILKFLSIVILIRNLKKKSTLFQIKIYLKSKNGWSQDYI